MSESLILRLAERKQAWRDIKTQLFPFIKAALEGGKAWVLTIKRETRTQAQNRLMWPLLTAFAKKLEWPVDGRMVLMTPHDWKDVLSAAFRQESIHLAMGLNGGVVLLGQRTSDFTKAEFAEWIEFLFATAADRGISLPEIDMKEVGL